jgi:pentatricopeptide repeat protein
LQHRGRALLLEPSSNEGATFGIFLHKTIPYESLDTEMMKCNRFGTLSQPYTAILTILILCFVALSFLVHCFVPPLRRHAPIPPRWEHLQCESTAASQVAVGSNELMSDEESMARFRGYLNWIAKNTRGWHHAAMAMDGELLAMEERWYGGHRPNGVPTSGRYHGSAIRPDPTCYGIVAEAFAKANLGRLGAEKAAEVLRRCHETHNGMVSVVLHTTVMKAWANAGEFVKARQLLSDMERRYANSGDDAMAPDMIAYTIYLNVLSDSKTISGQAIASEAMELLQEMHAKAESGENPKVRPNTYAYTAVMKCLARANDFVGIQHLFQDLRRRSQEAPEDVQGTFRPGKLVYGTMIGIYAESDLGDEGARMADALLKELQALHTETSDILYRPNPFILSSVLTAYAKVSSIAMLETALKRTDEIVAQCQQDEHLASDTSILEAGKLFVAVEWNVSS